MKHDEAHKQGQTDRERANHAAAQPQEQQGETTAHMGRAHIHTNARVLLLLFLLRSRAGEGTTRPWRRVRRHGRAAVAATQKQPTSLFPSSSARAG